MKTIAHIATVSIAGLAIAATIDNAGDDSWTIVPAGEYLLIGEDDFEPDEDKWYQFRGRDDGFAYREVVIQTLSDDPPDPIPGPDPPGDNLLDEVRAKFRDLDVFELQKKTLHAGLVVPDDMARTEAIAFIEGRMSRFLGNDYNKWLPWISPFLEAMKAETDLEPLKAVIAKWREELK